MISNGFRVMDFDLLWTELRGCFAKLAVRGFCTCDGYFDGISSMVDASLFMDGARGKKGFLEGDCRERGARI